MAERDTIWDRIPSFIKIFLLLAGGLFSTGAAYGVLSYRVDASDMRINDTIDKMVIMATDIAVIRERQTNSIINQERIEHKLDAALERMKD
jgi:hypothetical protein